jgi:nitric oxide reductase activation protein
MTDLTSGVDSNPVGQEDHDPQKDNHLRRILRMHIPSEAKRKAKQEGELAKEQQRLEEVERQRKERERKNRPKRAPFDLEKVTK